MKNNEYKLGDLVRLKSGGPIMIVNSGRMSGMVSCSWFDKFNHYHRADIHPELLIHDSSPDKNCPIIDPQYLNEGYQ